MSLPPSLSIVSRDVRVVATAPVVPSISALIVSLYLVPVTVSIPVVSVIASYSAIPL